MRAPHEEEWTNARGSVLVSCGPGDDDAGVFYGPADVAAERARLAHAAPDMARALLGMRRMARGTINHGIGCTCPVCVGSETALRKAGVLP